MSRNPVLIWLYTGAALVLLMVVIGGITRLTQSGLSMVEWNLIMGSFPPTSETEWNEVFDLYKASPEYRIANYNFTLDDFKSIFWWEYIHRVLGRLIGIVFIIPFAIFLFQKKISKQLLPKLLIIFFMGGFQGFLGWYMVKSGLVDVPHVSHYRLAIHLFTALILFAYILWVALGLRKQNVLQFENKSQVRALAIAGFIVLGIQIIYGAFVAGLKAGLYYNTWPKMNDYWIPPELGDSFQRSGIISLVENITSVQFIHRTTAWILTAIMVILYLRVRKISRLLVIGNIMIGLLALQIILGIGTLVMGVPVVLGVLHQLVAALLVGVFVVLLSRLRKNVDHS